MKSQAKLRIYVAMSGGVDSSVAAALLQKQGHDVTGIFFKPWSPDSKIAFCNWHEDRQDAMRVAAKLGIKFKTWDFSKEYGKQVAQYMIEGYRAGITPNPDIMCNKEIKFGLFLKKALAEGADHIATGHYARIARVKSYQVSKVPKVQLDKPDKHYKLLTGIDANKDQSYFLWTLTQQQLKYCLFPIGEYLKPEIRKLAKKFGLPNYNKKDSQGVCFIGQLNVKDFLTRYIKPKKGEIKLIEIAYTLTHSMNSGQAGSGRSNRFKTIGSHDGAYYYTIGQRHGLNIKDGQGPYFVADKDIQKNIIYVTNAAQESNIKNQISKIGQVNWISKAPKLPMSCKVKIRYRNQSVPAIISKVGTKADIVLIKFKKPIRALTPGQSAVFYRDQEVLGGGIIT